VSSSEGTVAGGRTTGGDPAQARGLLPEDAVVQGVVADAVHRDLRAEGVANRPDVVELDGWAARAEEDGGHHEVESIDAAGSQKARDGDRAAFDEQAPDAPGVQGAKDVRRGELGASGGEAHTRGAWRVLAADAPGAGILEDQMVGAQAKGGVEHHALGAGAGHPAHGEAGVVGGDGVGADQHGIREGAQAVGVVEVGGTADPLGCSAVQRDATVEALGEVCVDKGTVGARSQQRRVECSNGRQGVGRRDGVVCGVEQGPPGGVGQGLARGVGQAGSVGGGVGIQAVQPVLRAALRTLFVATPVWGCLAGCTGDVLPPDNAPDILILTVDTLRPDRLGAWGHPAADTPRMDALAAAGTRFSSATTPFPRTTPALASMLTGLLPHRHGAREVGEVVEHGRSLAEALSEAGYATVGVSGTPVAGPKQRMDRGFDRFAVHFDLPAPALADKALALVDEAASDRPLFLWVHFVDPHFPYLPEGAAPGPCSELGEQARDNALPRVHLFVDRDGVSSAALPDCLRLYDLEVAQADRGIGALVDGLTARGRRMEWTVLSSDHGEHFGEAGIFYEHGPSVDDAVLRIPLVVVGPDGAGRVDPGVATLEDVAPTLLDAAGLPVPPNLDGRSLLPRMSGTPDPSRVALAESGSALHLRFVRALRSGRPDKRNCVHDGTWSLCRRGQKTRLQLYANSADPDFEHNVAAAHPEVVARLSQGFEAWPVVARERTALSESGQVVHRPLLTGGYAEDAKGEGTDALRAALTALPDDAAPEVDSAVEEALKALGYL